MGNPGIINQNVEAPRPRDDSLERRRDRSGIGYVACRADRAAAAGDNRRSRVARRRAIDVEHLDVGPLPAEELRYCLPDARPATRDDGDLSIEFEHDIAGVEVLHIPAK